METTHITIAKHVIKSIKDILKTMAGLDAEVGKPFVNKDHSIVAGDVSAVVGITGAMNGTLSLTFPRASAIILVKSMLGDDIQDIEQDMRDAVGELTNMASGQARAGLATEGLTLQGSTPSIITDSSPSIQHRTAGPNVTIPFKIAANEFTVEFCFD